MPVRARGSRGPGLGPPAGKAFRAAACASACPAAAAACNGRRSAPNSGPSVGQELRMSELLDLRTVRSPWHLTDASTWGRCSRRQRGLIPSPLVASSTAAAWICTATPPDLPAGCRLDSARRAAGSLRAGSHGQGPLGRAWGPPARRTAARDRRRRVGRRRGGARLRPPCRAAGSRGRATAEPRPALFSPASR